MLEKLEARMKELGQELEQSACRHNALLGAMSELKGLYNDAVAEAPAVEAVAAVVAPAEAPALDAAVSAVESVE